MADEHILNSSALGLEQKHADLVEWAKERGVTINGIKPERLPHKGIGIVATRPLKVYAIEFNQTLRSNLKSERRGGC
jgi:hypothetical protein